MPKIRNKRANPNKSRTLRRTANPRAASRTTPKTVTARGLAKARERAAQALAIRARTKRRTKTRKAHLVTQKTDRGPARAIHKVQKVVSKDNPNRAQLRKVSKKETPRAQPVSNSSKMP